MKKEISMPVMAAIVVVFIALVGTIGYFMINKPAPPTPKVEALGSAIPGGGQSTGGASSITEAKN